MSQRALITGITGQDGSYLADLLLEKGYEVHGIVRRVSFEDPEHRLWRIRHLLGKLRLHFGAVEDFPSLYSIVEEVQPQELYHLAAQSFVSYAFEEDYNTINTNILGAQFVLSALAKKAPGCRFYFSGTSEMFGAPRTSPQDEETAFLPRSAYGISKLAGFHLTRNYRDAYGLHASSGILFNHESPRRGYEFVTRKITSAAAKIKLGLERKLELGNLEARRDWGHAREYVVAMWQMLQQDAPDDYVVASGATHTVREFLDVAFSHLGLDYHEHVEVNPKLFREPEKHVLQGDCAKARSKMGWQPRCRFEDLVREMVESDLDLYRKKVQFMGNVRSAP